jgi:hypothetical protein
MENREPLTWERLAGLVLACRLHDSDLLLNLVTLCSRGSPTLTSSQGFQSTSFSTGIW